MAKLLVSLLALPFLAGALPADAAKINAATTCSPLTASNPSTWWYENITHNGLSSFIGTDYSVFRNVVTDFNADNTGATDASGAIQKAINSCM